ncbi:MAG: hypothetical protein K6D94_10105, partial [Clostridiales bacterium]|nr:hypothetical protein [Clostridiales bacterium]
MSGVKLPFVPKFEQSERIKVLEARNQELALSGVRQLGIYGDHRCWIDIGPFPHMDKVPSRIEGYRMDCEQWGADYECMLDYTEPHIYPCETIVGEIYWEIGCIRPGGFDKAP